MAIAKRAADKGITKAVYDRGGFVYHGRVKALAEAPARAAWSCKEDTNGND